MTRLVYKICSRSEWEEARNHGRYTGSADDRRDGYIHLSKAGQVAATAQRHFAGRDDLLVVAIDAGSLGTALRLEAARSGTLYPHLYGDLAPTAAVWIAPLPLGPDGRHQLPEAIEQC